MDNRRCALILYAKGVQDSSALAIAEYLEDYYNKKIYVCAISDDELSNWKHSKIRRKTYIVACRNFPFANKWTCGLKHLFQNFKIKGTKKAFKEFKKPTEGFAGWWYKLGTKYRRVYNAILRYEPDIVLATTPELLAKAIKAKHMLGQPHMSVCALITDYQLDKLFVNHMANGYFVQNANIKQSLEAQGIEEDIIMVTGTPISEAVKVTHDKQEILKELEISEDKPNIVIIGGRYGNARTKEVFSKCLEVSDQYNIILLSGNSESIAKYCAYAATSKKKVDNIYIVDNIDDMSKIYTVADIIITIPTAQITYEAMYHNKKMIVLKGGDKIENLNAHYLTSNNLALRGVTPDEVMASLLKLQEDSDFCAELVKNQQLATETNSAKEISDMLAVAMQVHFDAKQEIVNKRQQVLQENNLSKIEAKPNKKAIAVKKPISKPIQTLIQEEKETEKQEDKND